MTVEEPFQDFIYKKLVTELGANDLFQDNFIIVLANPEGESLEELHELIITSLEDIEVISEKKTTLLGETAIRTIYVGSMEIAGKMVDLKVLNVESMYGGVYVSLQLTTEEKEFDKYLDDSDKIIDSFRIVLT